LIEQVLLNLLLNAQQALVESTVKDPQVLLSGIIHQRGYFMIEVTDNGPGISDEIINEIFVPFFTTKKQGTGVGLALSRQIMLAHGGNISVGKSSTDGAKFVLVF
jgi:two-component system nitrogen regulation sensor histidine kinase NtrY